MGKKSYIQTDLFLFAYMSDWYDKLAELADMTIQEPWRFRDAGYQTKNTQTPILERYIRETFRMQATAYNAATDQWEEQNAFHLSGRSACFHTGLFTRSYKPIYACFEPNKRMDSTLVWHFRGFGDDNSPLLKYAAPLPKNPLAFLPERPGFNPGWIIRVNVRHILEDSDNQQRIPAELRGLKFLPLLLETATELGRRRAMMEPAIVVPQAFRGRIQYLLPISLSDPERVDLAMTLSIMEGYYQGETCLTPQMAYLNARILGRPTVHWLAGLVE